MDSEIKEALIKNLENYFPINGLNEENEKTRFILTLFVKSAAIWMCKQNDDSNLLKCSSLKKSV